MGYYRCNATIEVGGELVECEMGRHDAMLKHAAFGSKITWEDDVLGATPNREALNTVFPDCVARRCRDGLNAGHWIVDPKRGGYIAAFPVSNSSDGERLAEFLADAINNGEV